MAVSLSVVAAKDSAGTAIAGGLQAQDKSGTGAGPFTLGHVMIDGLAGTNMAAVTAANAVKVDGSAVTQPVSIATAPVLVAGAAIIGKVGIDQTTDGTTNAVHLVAGTAIAGKVGIDQTTPGTTNGVQVNAALPAGTNAIGKLAANSGVNIGTVTVDATQLSSLGQTTMALSAPVVQPSDTNGPYSATANFVSGAITTAMTGTTTTSLVAAPGASLRNYITTFVCSNSHATVGTDIIIQDGSGGTTLMTIPAAAVYGGAVINLPTPLKQPTTNTAIFCANVTTGASTKVSAVGYKGA